MCSRDEGGSDEILSMISSIPPLQQWSEVPIYRHRRTHSWRLSINDGSFERDFPSRSQTPNNVNQPSWVEFKGPSDYHREDEVDETVITGFRPNLTEQGSLLAEPHIRVLLVIYGIYSV